MSRHAADPNRNVNLTIDGIAVTVPEGTTILEAAKKAGVQIPTLCDHPSLGKRAVCRLCVVEADGRSKLIAACANEVWEGANIVTNNRRIFGIRKTIIELLLAGHPEECLCCIRSGKCELQTLAGIYSSYKESSCHDVFEHGTPHCVLRGKVKYVGILVHDMDKCVKCGRCIELCQEIVTVRAINSANRSVNYGICTPYGEALSEGPCICCGGCADVCPVGAIHENDQCAELSAELNNKERHIITQLAASIGPAMDGELGLPQGTVTSGRLISALKQIGFDKVFDAEVSAKTSAADHASELLERIKSKSHLPMIISCSPSLIKFINNFYPDLAGHLPRNKGPEQTFGSLAKTWYNKESGHELSKISYVSVMPCIAKRLEAHQTTGFNPVVDIALTAREIARIIRLAGIEFIDLPESSFDSCPNDLRARAGFSEKPDSAFSVILNGVYKAYTHRETQVPQKTKEAEIELNGNNIKALEANGLACTRTVMDSIRKNKCEADLVLIKNCKVCYECNV
ncbi:MAG: (2Fe-2S)-binding protein [Treponema sp.]|jgi:NADH-quinone oxidoreductase subunit G/NADP-reducing hydrogenase subunit HndD|nr:(2Fe-2S)-binding protein [Treponema sp.]